MERLDEILAKWQDSKVFEELRDRAETGCCFSPTAAASKGPHTPPAK
jgi:hypothetical protein